MNSLKTYYSDKFIQNKFNHLLVVLLLSFIVQPLFDALQIHFPILTLIFFLVILLTLRAVLDNSKIFCYVSIFASLCFILLGEPSREAMADVGPCGWIHHRFGSACDRPAGRTGKHILVIMPKNNSNDPTTQKAVGEPFQAPVRRSAQG